MTVSFDFENIRRSQYLDRHMHPTLPNITEARQWLRCHSWEQAMSFYKGVNYSLRPVVGLFLGKPSIAVMRHFEIVCLKFIQPKIKMAGAWDKILISDGGLLLLHSDFNTGRTGNIRLTDLVLTHETDCEPDSSCIASVEQN